MTWPCSVVGCESDLTAYAGVASLFPPRSHTFMEIDLETLSTVILLPLIQEGLCNSYTMGCPPVRGDNPQALASGLSYVQVDKHGITILYHLHQYRLCTSRDISW